MKQLTDTFLATAQDQEALSSPVVSNGLEATWDKLEMLHLKDQDIGDAVNWARNAQTNMATPAK